MPMCGSSIPKGTDMWTSSVTVPQDLQAEVTEPFANELEWVHGGGFKINGKPWFLWFSAQGKLRVIPSPEGDQKCTAFISHLREIMEKDETMKFVEANEPKGSEHLPVKLRAM